ncbi:MAG TPA: HAD-IA family hydrolase [Candidatus Limnocylindrales bacterium]
MTQDRAGGRTGRQPVAGDAVALLAGIELVVFDKDGTLIDFDAMWGPWVIELTRRLEAASRVELAERLAAELGFDRAAGRTIAGRPLAVLPMAMLRQATVDVVAGAGLGPSLAEDAVAAAWFVPDPTAAAVPLADLRRIFTALRDDGRRIAVATSDDRRSTEQTMAALGVAALIDGYACADDGLPRKPAPDMLLDICRRLGAEPARTAVVGDSAVDLAMARAAGAGRVIGVLSGVSRRADLEALADAVLPSVAYLAPEPAG